MSKTCARCEKTVYPTEELKCLDKIWHKGCFKCQGCGMTLNMRTYKGFNKQPYCEAHIPKAKATTMAETPELKRIAENTKIQSNVKYHADFEKSKGKFTQVADDPETLRIKQNSKIISNVAYHGELEKKAAMEQKRTLNENGELIDVIPDENGASTHQAVASVQHPQQHHQQPQQQYQQQHRVAANNHNSAAPQHKSAPHHQAQYAAAHYAAPVTPQHQVGKISDYDPLSDQQRPSPYSARQSSTVIYTSDRGPVTNPPQRKIGSVADLDPVNDVYGSLNNDYRGSANHNQQQYQQPTQHQQSYSTNHHQSAVSQQPPPAHNANVLTGRVYRALYDYEAQDADEVSFLDGDLIVEAASVDAGWMTGTVQRTGRTGMLPANYVERVLI